MVVTKADIGKRVTFKVKACTWPARKETRIIRDVLDSGHVVVRYVGSNGFLLQQDEVISLEGRMFLLMDLETNKKYKWSLESIIAEINRDRSDDWTDYDESDWREGWDEWCEGDYYTLLEEL